MCDIVQDVILAPGTSGVLEIIFGTVCEPGQTILIPRPHFTIYGCLAGALDIKLNSYKLLVRMWDGM
jgi:tyrosine aminotransferase